MEEKKEKLSFREIWKNKRYRALIILGVYFVFFLFLIGSIRNNQGNVPPTSDSTTTNTSFESLDNYEATYTFMIDSTSHFVHTTRYQEEEVIEVEETSEEYYIKGDTFYSVKNQKLETTSDKLYGISFFKLRPDELSKLLKYSTFQHQTEFQDNRVRKVYQMTVKGFFSWLDGSFHDAEEIVTITTEEISGLMTTFTIDLSNYQNETITITYQNHNQLSNLETNYQ